VQVSPLIERIPWIMDTNRLVTIPDRLFAGFTSITHRFTIITFTCATSSPSVGASYGTLSLTLMTSGNSGNHSSRDVNLPLN